MTEKNGIWQRSVISALRATEEFRILDNTKILLRNRDMKVHVSTPASAYCSDHEFLDYPFANTFCHLGKPAQTYAINELLRYIEEGRQASKASKDMRLLIWMIVQTETGSNFVDQQQQAVLTLRRMAEPNHVDVTAPLQILEDLKDVSLVRSASSYQLSSVAEEKVNDAH